MAGFFDARFLTTAALICAVIFVNGWTDAPSAISTCILSGALSARRAAGMAAACNLLGIGFAYTVNDSVSESIFSSVSFPSEYALTALCAAMTSIVVFAVGAWYFGIPTSEGHALMAALSGSAAALGSGRVRLGFWGGVGLGIVITTAIGFILGFILFRLIKRANVSKNKRFLRRAQIISAALLSFMHGAQDGQKFTAVLLLGIFMSGAKINKWAAVAVCGALLSLGTALGGGRIIKRIGDITRVDEAGGICCDAAAFISLLICTLTGIPVSTTHSKTTAVLGVGVSRGLVRMRAWGGMAFAWILTFPICFIISFFITKICI